jgi:D-Tyr-tRNAtyr deacylase
MAGDQAKELYDYFVSKVQEGYEPEKVKNGVFQAMMKVGLVNDGPVGGSTLCSLKPPIGAHFCFHGSHRAVS